MESGTIGILNVGAGDIALSFDPSNPAERIRAARVVKDMLRRGYALLVEVERGGEKSFERATDFDEKNCRYIIADFDPIQAVEADKQKEEGIGEGEQVESASSAPRHSEAKPRRGRPKEISIDANGTRGIAVGRSAGG